MAASQSEPEPGAAPDATEIADALDPLGFGETWLRAAAAAMNEPEGLVAASQRFFADAMEAGAAVTAKALGQEATPAIEPQRKDRRFRDPAWQDNPALFGLMQGYLLASRFAEDVLGVASESLAPADRERLAFATEAAIDAAAPTNYFWTNPTAVKKAIETGGASVARGMSNFADDLLNNDGLPSQIRPGTFAVGEDLAITPGKVVYRNDLMELIQYLPQTETVHEYPLLLSPPWINKYYIMDLAPGRSFVEWAVQHGHTVFVISYRNPGEDDAGLRFDDYLTQGPLAALDVVCDITKAEKVNLAGLCLGGTMATAMLAYLAAHGDERINATTLLNTLVDFSEPGRLGAFTDEASIERVQRRMDERGFLEASEMMGIFTFMRSNDLVWNYAVNNWLIGEDPPPFDILAWNGDSTRMPATMHGSYLRSCYLNNELAKGELELAETELDPAAITGDLYVLAAVQDHITPWESSYMTTQVLPNADTRFVLSASGHIAGIVNPPSPKAWYRTGDALPADADEWMASSEQHEGTWWEDWAAWLGERAGGQRKPPRAGNRKYKQLGDAPGTYVLG